MRTRLLPLALIGSLLLFASCGERTGIDEIDGLLDQVDPQPEPEPQPDAEPDAEPDSEPEVRIPDEDPPTVTFGLPDDPCLGGEVTFTFTVADEASEVGIVRAELAGTDLPLSDDGDGTYSGSRDTSGLFQGLHRLIVTAIDTSNNVVDVERVFGKADPDDFFVAADFVCGEVPPDVVDETPPTVTLLRPQSGEVVGAELLVQATASDDVGPITLIAAAGEASATMIGGGGIASATLDLTAEADGPLTVTVTAVDGADRMATRSVNVDLDLTPPTLSIDEPASGATVVALTDVVVTASDDRQLDRVVLLEGGEVRAIAVMPNPGTTDEFALFYGLPCEGLPRSSTFEVQARDRAGNVSTASIPVTITADGCQ
jgi:hypothetical protein